MKKINLTSSAKKIIILISIMGSTLFISCEAPELENNIEKSQIESSSLAATIRAANAL